MNTDRDPATPLMTAEIVAHGMKSSVVIGAR